MKRSMKRSIKPILLCALTFFSSTMILAASTHHGFLEHTTQTVNDTRASHPIKSSHAQELQRLHQAALNSYNTYVAWAPDASKKNEPFLL